jgi:hypothetical protein
MQKLTGNGSFGPSPGTMCSVAIPDAPAVITRPPADSLWCLPTVRQIEPRQQYHLRFLTLCLCLLRCGRQKRRCDPPHAEGTKYVLDNLGYPGRQPRRRGRRTATESTRAGESRRCVGRGPDLRGVDVRIDRTGTGGPQPHAGYVRPGSISRDGRVDVVQIGQADPGGGEGAGTARHPAARCRERRRGAGNKHDECGTGEGQGQRHCLKLPAGVKHQ